MVQSFAHWYIAIIKNTQDPSNNVETFKYVAPKHREKTASYYYANISLPSTKIIIDYHKGFNIKFNLSLCAYNKYLQRSSKSILNKASRNTLKEVIKAVKIDINDLKRRRTHI